MAVIDDRRSEPRYPVDGRVEIQREDQNLAAQALDLSLNGALLAFDQAHGLLNGQSIGIEVWIEAHCHFKALAMVVHVEGKRVGIEFTGMSTADFDTFSGLILLLARQRLDITA